MKIYVIGDSHQADEIDKKTSGEHQVRIVDSVHKIEKQSSTIVFDFSFDDSLHHLKVYRDYSNVHLFINSTRTSLSEITFLSDFMLPNLYGIAGDPTFIERPVLEVSAHSKNKDSAQKLFSLLGLEATLVDDRVGLVTPRIISMIINEAYYTVMEGTASKEDIDTGMKLGTNYPMGPFEWVAKWGIANIYELLEALYMDTKNERYKICPLLKQEYLSLAYS